MTYDILDINAQLRRDPEAAIARWEQSYADQIDQVARYIIDTKHTSPVVLLAGPSGSSKTSTATAIRNRLLALGQMAHLISMDNYYIARDDPNFPRLPDGSPDFEAPEGLDLQLLNEHFSILEAGEDIYVPVFDFPTQRRLDSKGEFLDATQGDVFIFEGIHALNELFTSSHPNAARVYVAPEALFEKDGRPFCGPVQLRLLRRVVRDHQFRGATADYSLSLWQNVIDSEKKYVLPHRENANCRVVTTMPYELGVLRPFAQPLLEDLPEDVPCRDQVDAVRQLLWDVDPVDAALVPEKSFLHEFIG